MKACNVIRMYQERVDSYREYLVTIEAEADAAMLRAQISVLEGRIGDLDNKHPETEIHRSTIVR